MSSNILSIIKQKFPKLFFTEMFTDKYILSAEKDEGFIEYKRTLADCDEKREQKYATQMRWRISENTKNQCATYFLGVDDDGTIIGLNHNEIYVCIEKFVQIASTIDASITGIHIIHVENLTILKIMVKIKKIICNYLVDFDSAPQSYFTGNFSSENLNN